jgi:hypothetical protein
MRSLQSLRGIFMKASTVAAFGAVTLLASAAPLRAQLAYVGVRGVAGVPANTFAETFQAGSQDVRGAKQGTGYGFDAGIGLGVLGLYAGYDHIDFGCETAACGADGKYKLNGVSAGVRAGVPLFPVVKPWVKAGVTFNEINGTTTAATATKITSDRNPGYELGAGIDIPVLMLFSISPEVKYVGQELDLKGAYSGTKTNVSYYAFSIGLRARTPF